MVVDTRGTPSGASGAKSCASRRVAVGAPVQTPASVPAGGTTRMVCGAVGPVHITSSRPVDVAQRRRAAIGGSSLPSDPLHRRELALPRQRGAQIQAIARAGQRHVQQPLGFLALARSRVIVGLALVIADRHRRLARRSPLAAPSATRIGSRRRRCPCRC